MKRREDWRERLVEYVNQSSKVPYRYGEMDCWCFSSGCVRAQTDVVLYPEETPPRSAMAAYRIMDRRGWETVEDIMTEALGPSVSADEASTGDIVSVWMAGDLHLAVKVGDAVLTPGQAGLEAVAPSKWNRAWKVG